MAALHIRSACLQGVVVSRNCFRYSLLSVTPCRYFDHLPEQLGVLSLVASAQFLNNSMGRWEHLLENWPLELHLSDPINPIFKTSRTK